MPARAQSSSSIKKAECLESYKHIYIEKLKKFESGAAAQTGTAVHKIHELYFQKIVQSQEENKHNEDLFKEAIETVLQDVSEETIKNDVFKITKSLNPETYLYEIALTKGTTEKRIAIDRDFNKIAYDSKDAYARGIIDVLWFEGDTLYILDYKTNSQQNADKKQLEFYSWLAYEYYKNDSDINFDNVVLLYAYLRFPHDPLKKVAEFTTKHIRENIKPGIVKTIELVNNTDEFPPNPSPQRCNFCEVSYACSLLSDLRKTPLKPEDQITKEDAKHYAKIYLVAKATADKLKPMVEGFIQKEKELDLGEEILYFKTTKRRNPIKENFIPQLQKLKKDQLIDELKVTQKLIHKYGLKATDEDFTETISNRLDSRSKK